MAVVEGGNRTELASIKHAYIRLIVAYLVKMIMAVNEA